MIHHFPEGQMSKCPPPPEPKDYKTETQTKDSQTEGERETEIQEITRFPTQREPEKQSNTRFLPCFPVQFRTHFEIIFFTCL